MDENLKHQETIVVETDGERIEVWNFVNVNMAYQFRGGGIPKETFLSSSQIEHGGGGPKPDYITKWLESVLWAELNLDADRLKERFDIEVIDIESDDVVVV